MEPLTWVWKSTIINSKITSNSTGVEDEARTQDGSLKAADARREVETILDVLRDRATQQPVILVETDAAEVYQRRREDASDCV